jgi:PDZ domain-containing protein
MMVDSQKEATAAAHAARLRRQADGGGLRTDDSAAQGILQKGDVIRSANGQAITETDQLRTIINAGAGAPVRLAIERPARARTSR